MSFRDWHFFVLGLNLLKTNQSFDRKSCPWSLNTAWVWCFDSGTRKITLGIQNTTFFVRLRRGDASFWILRVISLVPESKQQQTRSIQRTQTPPRLWPFVKVKKADVIRCTLIIALHLIVPYVYVFNTLRDITIFFILCDLWPSPVTFSFVKVAWSLVIRWTLCC